jgi:hypothetical protein
MVQLALAPLWAWTDKRRWRWSGMSPESPSTREGRTVFASTLSSRVSMGGGNCPSFNFWKHSDSATAGHLLMPFPHSAAAASGVLSPIQKPRFIPRNPPPFGPCATRELARQQGTITLWSSARQMLSKTGGAVDVEQNSRCRRLPLKPDTSYTFPIKMLSTTTCDLQPSSTNRPSKS